MNKAFDIVFNDEYLIVVNKIAKILVQPVDKCRGEFKTRPYNTLTSLLAKALKQKVYPCHRLDRETSGLILYAKNSQIQNEIMNQFRTGEVKKKYIALIRGRLRPKRGFWENEIIDQEGRRFGEMPKPAKTSYQVIGEFPNFSVLELEPLTGRTNQLRIQLAGVGHPILGERKYAFGRDFEVRFRRLALHAFYLSFIHPISRERVNLRIDLPLDIKEFLHKRRG